MRNVTSAQNYHIPSITFDHLSAWQSRLWTFLLPPSTHPHHHLLSLTTCTSYLSHISPPNKSRECRGSSNKTSSFCHWGNNWRGGLRNLAKIKLELTVSREESGISQGLLRSRFTPAPPRIHLPAALPVVFSCLKTTESELMKMVLTSWRG